MNRADKISYKFFSIVNLRVVRAPHVKPAAFLKCGVYPVVKYF